MNIYDVCKKNGILEEGHFVLRSGEHSDTYFRKTKITLFPHLYGEIIRQFENKITRHFKRVDFDAITSPATAGISFGAPVALDVRKPFIFPEKVDKNSNKMKFREEYERVLFNKKIIIIEDVITTGQSVANTAYEISIHGGIPVMVLCILNRKSSVGSIEYEYKIDFKNNPNDNVMYMVVPIISLIEKDVKSWKAEECPCKKLGDNLRNKI